MKWREWEGRKKDFEAELKAGFPMLYEGLGIHWREGGMLGGIGVGPGWWDIIREVSRGLESLMKREPAFGMKVVQVKEKYAGCVVCEEYALMERGFCRISGCRLMAWRLASNQK